MEERRASDRKLNALLEEQNALLREVVGFITPIAQFFQSASVVMKFFGWLAAAIATVYGLITAAKFKS